MNPARIILVERLDFELSVFWSGPISISILDQLKLNVSYKTLDFENRISKWVSSQIMRTITLFGLAWGIFFGHKNYIDSRASGLGL